MPEAFEGGEALSEAVREQDLEGLSWQSGCTSPTSAASAAG
jgi:hypothetical protein